MKAILLSFLFIGFLAACWAETDVVAISKACLAESKATDKDVDDFWSPNVNYDSTTPNMKCQLKCVMEKMGHLKGGAFDTDKAMKDWKEVNELKAFKVFDPKVFVNCKNEKGANDCETAFKITKCVRQNKA